MNFDEIWQGYLEALGVGNTDRYLGDARMDRAFYVSRYAETFS